jgi:maltose-binding protein MalE
MRKFVIAVLLAVLALGAVSTAVAQDDDNLLIWADEQRAVIIEELGVFFAQEFGIGITVQELAFGDIRDNFKTAAPAGEGPDLIVGAHDWLGELVVNGLLTPVDLGDKADDFVEVAKEAFTYEGTLYAMPQYTENVALAYNPDMLAEFGYDAPPATWEEAQEISAAISEASDGEQRGFVIATGNPYLFFGIQTAFGGYVFGFDEQGNYVADDLGIDTEGSIAAAQWFDGMVEAGLQPETIADDAVLSLFEAGDAAMFIAGPWNLERLSLADVPFEIAALPAGPAGAAQPFLGVQGFMISSFSDKQLLAELFLLDFIASNEIEVTIEYETADGFEEVTATPMEHLGRARPAAYEPALANATNPYFPAFAEAGAEALAMPAIPEMGSVWTPWTDALNLIAQGQLDGEAAFMQAAEQIRTSLEQ